MTKKEFLSKFGRYATTYEIPLADQANAVELTIRDDDMSQAEMQLLANWVDECVKEIERRRGMRQ